MLARQFSVLYGIDSFALRGVYCIIRWSEINSQEVTTMRKVFNFLLGFMTGALVGGVTALLMAPSSGPELQKRIRTRVDDLIEEGQQAADARRAELEAQLEAFKRGESITIAAQ